MNPSPSQADYETAVVAFLTAFLPASVEIVQAQENRVPEPSGPDYVTVNETGRRRLSTNVTTYADCSFTGTAAGTTLTVSAVLIGTIRIGARLLGEGVAIGTAIRSQTSGMPGGAGVYALTVPQPVPVFSVPLSTGQADIAQPTEITIQVDVYGPNSSDNAGTLTTLLRDDYGSLWWARAGYRDRGMDLLDVSEARQLAFIDGENQFEDRWTFDLKIQVDQVTSPAQDFADSVTVTSRVVDAVTNGQEATGEVAAP